MPVMIPRRQFLYSLAGLVAIGCTKTGTPEPIDASPQTGGPDFPDAPPDAAGGSSTGDAGGGADAAPPSCPMPTATISSNHSHTCVVPPADIDAGVEKSYDITGTSNHPHTIKVTAAQFATLRAGGQVTITSTFDDGHTHNVTLRCA
jgi:hypothetical protein